MTGNRIQKQNIIILNKTTTYFSGIFRTLEQINLKNLEVNAFVVILSMAVCMMAGVVISNSLLKNYCGLFHCII